MVVGVKLSSTKDTTLIHNIQNSSLSNSALLRTALKYYFDEVNQFQQEENGEENSKVNQKVNRYLREKMPSVVNLRNSHQSSLESNDSIEENTSKLSIIHNYELIEHLKRENEWLKNRVEFYEQLLKHNYQDSKNHLSSSSKDKISFGSRIRM